MKAKLNLAFDYRVRILTRTKSQSNIIENGNRFCNNAICNLHRKHIVAMSV